jgi:hypothetical protein
MDLHRPKAHFGAGLVAALLIATAGAGTVVARSAPLPTSSVAVPLRATAGQTSLLAVSAFQLTQARARKPDAYLFEVHTTIQPQDISSGQVRIPFVVGNFATPNNNVNYLSVGEWFTNPGQRTQTVDKVGFVRAVCNGGAARPNCGSATGRPEPRVRHLPLVGWKIDLGGIVRILRTNSYVSTNYSEITVSTAGRASVTTPGPVARLATLAPAQPVILVREAATPRYHFILINAATGVVIDKGIALAPPLPANAGTG